MAVACGMNLRSTICHCFLGLVLLTHTSAVHLSRQLVHHHQDATLDQNMTSEFVTVGEFKFCKRSNDSYRSLAKCNMGRSSAPDYKDPSMTALTVNIILGMQWAIGLNKDKESACLVTAEFKNMPCACNKHKRRPDPFAVFFAAWAKLIQHPLEAYTFLTYLQPDTYIRTKVLDGILTRATSRNHFDQVVFLGTGFDTRPYRLGAGMENISMIFETDLKEGLDWKRAAIDKCEISPINGEGRLKYMYLNLREKEPFKELWQHENFTAAGNTLIVAEQVFTYIEVFDNMNWIRQLRDTAITAGGTATFVLMTTRGPNFDSSLAPRCYNRDECLLNQMPMDEKKSNTYMSALGWEKLHDYVDLEKNYRDLKHSNLDSGYVGVFTTDGAKMNAS